MSIKTANPAVGAVGVRIDMAGEPVEPPAEESGPVSAAKKKMGVALPGDAAESTPASPDEERPQRSTPDA